MTEPRFKLGDRVIVTWRRDNALTVRTGQVSRVLKSGNFRVNDQTTQFRQSGEPAGVYRARGLRVELETPETLAWLEEHRTRRFAARLAAEAGRVLNREAKRPTGDVAPLIDALNRFLYPGKFSKEAAP